MADTPPKAPSKKGGRMTALLLRALPAGDYARDDWPRGRGSFEARRRSANAPITFFFRYTRSDGTRDRLPLGAWSESGGSGITLEDARRQAEALSRRYFEGATDLRLAMDAEASHAADEAKRAAEAIELERARASATVGVLVIAYVDVLHAAKKPSAAEVERTLNRHLRDPFPGVWALPARDAQADDFMPVLDRIKNAGKLREAAKMRSYLRAAFASAVKARVTAGASKALRELNIKANPLRDVAAIDGATNARDRALSVAELRAYFAALDVLPAADRALLRFHLLTGAQRVEQLSRCLLADVDMDAGTIRLMDAKGKRKQARRHIVPLIPEAHECIAQMSPMRLGQFVFTVTQGETGCSYHSLNDRIKGVASALVASGLAVSAFTPGDLRRTVETRLAALAVPTEVRAHLQSHGLSGVQARHYQRHDYMQEMRAALERLHTLAGEKRAAVTSIKGRARR